MLSTLLFAVILITSFALVTYVSPLLPIVVALVTKANAPPAVKATVLIVLALITALVADAIRTGSSIAINGLFLGRFAIALAVSIASHFGLLKPLGVTGSKGAVARKVPGGIG